MGKRIDPITLEVIYHHLKSIADDYSVVIDRESMAFDMEKTIKLRKDKAQQREPYMWTYDRGPELGKE